MKTVFSDTSFLFSLYGNDIYTKDAVACVTKLPVPLTITDLNEFEFGNALRLAQFRSLLSATEVALRWSRYESAARSGRLAIETLRTSSFLLIAKRLSERHTWQAGHRSFDILLVAAALHLRADVFLTFDARQQALARAEGLALAI